MSNQVIIAGQTPDFTINVTTPVGQTITEANSASIKAAVESVDAKLPDPVNLGGQDCIPTAIQGGTIDVGQNGAWTVTANLGTISTAATENTQLVGNARLSSIDGKLNSLGQKVMANSVPVAIAGDQTPVPVSGALLTSIDSKLPTLTTNPAVNASAMPVRQVPSRTPGTLTHVTHSLAITNLPNKLLFGFSNGSGANVYVDRIHLINAQNATHSGTIARVQVQSGSSAITGGTTISAVTNPALIQCCRNPSLSGPSGLTWNTAGTLGGTVQTHEQCWWSTDEVTANGTGVANDIASKGVYNDVFDFCDDPIVVPNGYSLAVVCDSTAGWNGTMFVDFNLYA